VLVICQPKRIGVRCVVPLVTRRLQAVDEVDPVAPGKIGVKGELLRAYGSEGVARQREVGC
jgi:hypothetical protein